MEGFNATLLLATVRQVGKRLATGDFVAATQFKLGLGILCVVRCSLVRYMHGDLNVQQTHSPTTDNVVLYSSRSYPLVLVKPR